MIQLNLLPDVKLEYVNAQKRKRLVTSLSAIITIAFFAIFLFLLLFVRVGQKSHINGLTKDIASTNNQVTQNQDLNKILTIQNQLKSLPDLHNKKVISSRLFDYLSLLTPQDATISDVDVDFTANTLVIKGNGKDLATVNKFADTLKFTDYKVLGQTYTQLPKAFSSVVLSSYSVLDRANNGNNASYELSFSFNPEIFANTGKNDDKSVELVVPNIISTRSEVEKPTDLFQEQPTTQGTGN